jgi:hypothetical protein
MKVSVDRRISLKNEKKIKKIALKCRMYDEDLNNISRRHFRCNYTNIPSKLVNKFIGILNDINKANVAEKERRRRCLKNENDFLRKILIDKKIIKEKGYDTE